MPVQSPFEEKWNKMSVGALALHLMTFVDEKYESSIHIHDNLQILSLFSLDEYGRLLWNNEALGSGDGSGHTDHAGELIRPAVIAVPRQPPGADFTLLPGECYMYFDVVSAVDGETPTASGTGGLDVDELWSELGGSSDNRVISSEHLPEDVVYDADLDNYYTKSDSDAKYVTLATGQVITGKKTFNNDVIFGGNGSKMFVPSTAGAGLYYMYFDVASAVNGETPTASGGGLDVDELWAELGGSSSNKVIAQSHIPDIYVKKAGDTMTGSLNVSPTLQVYESASHATRISLNWSGTIARIYAISDDGQTYQDLSLGQSPEDTSALYFDASASCWGIGTTSPAYKLDVAGTLRATGQGTFDTIKITDNTSAAHLSFGRTDNFNYISLPGNRSTLAIAPGGDIRGAGTALCISNSATYPGYHNGTISLGTSSYRWSNVYSVLGNFSGLMTAGSIAVTGKLFVPSSEGNSKYYIRFE